MTGSLAHNGIAVPDGGGPKPTQLRGDPVEALARLDAALAGGRLIVDPSVVDAYRRDEAPTVTSGTPLAVLLAGGTGDVSAALQWATTHRVPVVPRGAGTGVSGGAAAIDCCLVLCTERMTEIRELDPADQLAVAEAGVVNADLDRAAGAVGLMYPPDPASFETCTIGGNVATNAGGLRCVKYGVTRDSVLGLEVVLADGRVIHTGRRTVKGVAGYDLTGLFVGSEGTLGVVTAATVRLRPRPPHQPVTVVGSFPATAAAGAAVAAVVAAGITPSLLELIGRATLRAIHEWKHMGIDGDPAAMLIAQADGPDAQACAEAMERHFQNAGAELTYRTSDQAEAAQLLEVRRLAYPVAERMGRCMSEDIGVPRSKLPDILERIEDVARRHGVTILTVAHAGDGNVHPTFVFDRPGSGCGVDAPPQVWAAAEEVFRAALDLGGTLTGEHGIGVLKRRWLGLELGDDVMGLHGQIKAAFDPLGILNPGKGF